MVSVWGVTNFPERITNPKYFQLAVDLNCWQRIDMPFSLTMNPDMTYIKGNWYEKSINICEKAGLPVIAGLNHPAPWVGGEGFAPRHILQWKKFIDTVVRANPYVKHWQVLAEPNHKWVWNPPDKAPYSYVDFLHMAYETIKTIDDKNQVVFGAPTATWVDFYTVCYERGARWWFDIAAYHSYNMIAGKTIGAREKEHKALRDLMTLHCDQHKKVWITETGWRTAGDEQTQADRLTTNITKRFMNWEGVDGVFIFLLHDPPKDNENYGYGLTDENGVPKIVYNEYKKFTTGVK